MGILNRHIARPLLAAGLAALFVAPALANEKVKETGIVLRMQNEDGELNGKKRVTWPSIVKMLNDKLGNAQQVNIYTDVCNDGGLIKAAMDADNGLTPKYVIGTSIDECDSSEDGCGNINENPPGRLKVGSNYYFSYKAYLTKRIKAMPKPTVKQAHDSADADANADDDLDQDAQYKAGPGANEGLKIDEGMMSSHALVFGGDCNSLYFAPVRELYKCLRALGFTEEHLYYNQYSNQNLPEGGKMSGPGTKANFMKALMDLKACVDMNPGKETVTMFLFGHGFQEDKNVCRPPSAIPGEPKQGEPVPGSDEGKTLGLATGPDFWARIKEDALEDDPTLHAVELPHFFFAASEHFLTSPMIVELSDGLGGPPVFAGFFDPAQLQTVPGSDAGLIEAPLDPRAIGDLVLLYDGLPQLEMRLQLVPGDFLRIAIEDDLFHDPTYPFDTYGVGIRTEVVGATAMTAPPCSADLDGDGAVGSSDLALLIGTWGATAPAGTLLLGDVNFDGVVNATDLAELIGLWGPCP